MRNGVQIDRRSVLLAGLSGAAAGVIALPARGAARPASGVSRAPRLARNVIFMVADGMSTGTLTLSHMASLARRGKPSVWVDLWNRPGVRRATATTFSADSLVTDSAAGGSAWGVGVHINNGCVNITPDGRQLTPIGPHALQSGRALGLVTTTRVTHATPASFIANVPLRDLEDGIAEQMLQRGVTVALGGGGKHFPKALLDQHADYTVVRTAEELSAIGGSGGPLLGLFAQAHLPMMLDRPAEVPTLADMTRAALQRLAAKPEGFLLQVEGGRVDHAAHTNDAASLIAEQLAFDDAIAAVLAFVDGRDDTLVILTTDHGNANPGLTLYGPRGKEAFARLDGAKASLELIAAEIDKVKETDERVATGAALVEQHLGVRLDEAEQSLWLEAWKHHRVAPFAELNDPMLVLGGLLANHFGVSFVSGNHTSDLVEVTALGPGSALLQPMIDNTDLHGMMVAALGLPEAAALPGNDRIIKPVAPKAND